MGLKVIGYIRVSSNSQTDNTSFESQTRAITRFCERSDHNLVEIRRETGTASGKAKRRVFDSTLADILRNQADALVVYRLDRFARSTLEGLQVATALKTAKKDLLVVDLGFDTSTPIGTCILSVLLAFAELERSMIQSRVQEGQRRVIEQGFYCGGRPPFGWRVTGHRTKRILEPDMHEQGVLKYIYHLKEMGLSHKKIAKRLNAENYHTKANTKWSQSTIGNIFNRPGVFCQERFSDASRARAHKSTALPCSNVASDLAHTSELTREPNLLTQNY